MRLNATHARQRVDRKISQAAVLGKGHWLMVLLAIRRATHRLVTAPRRVATGLSVRRVLTTVLFIVVTATPSALYLIERSHRQAEERAYKALALASAVETSFLRSSLSLTIADRDQLTEALLEAGYTVRAIDEVKVKVVATGYSSSVRETDSTPFITASNTRTRDGILALSRDLLRRYTPEAPFDFGDRVYVSGLGEFIVEDSMNSKWHNRIDVWFPSRLEAIRFGVKEVYLQTINEDLSPPEISETEPPSSVSGM